MTDCGRVEEWLNKKHPEFEDVDDVIEYMENNDSRSALGFDAKEWGNFWICVEQHDFIYSYTIDKRGRLQRRLKKKGWFAKLDIDPATRQRLIDLLLNR